MLDPPASTPALCMDITVPVTPAEPREEAVAARGGSATVKVTGLQRRAGPVTTPVLRVWT